MMQTWPWCAHKWAQCTPSTPAPGLTATSEPIPPRGRLGTLAQMQHPNSTAMLLAGSALAWLCCGNAAVHLEPLLLLSGNEGYSLPLWKKARSALRSAAISRGTICFSGCVHSGDDSWVTGAVFCMQHPLQAEVRIEAEGQELILDLKKNG